MNNNNNIPNNNNNIPNNNNINNEFHLIQNNLIRVTDQLQDIINNQYINQEALNTIMNAFNIIQLNINNINNNHHQNNMINNIINQQQILINHFINNNNIVG